MSVFQPFSKIPRLYREIVVTEKIDGTNALVAIFEDGTIRAGSRSQWITPENDNYGFAAWVQDNETELQKLGVGYHYGEWWGSGIQRRYGLDHKRFSLFNVSRWADDRPTCCHVVPIIYQGPFNQNAIEFHLRALAQEGSYAAPGFDKPEGIMIYHTAAKQYFKVTLEKDTPKGLV